MEHISTGIVQLPSCDRLQAHSQHSGAIQIPGMLEAGDLLFLTPIAQTKDQCLQNKYLQEQEFTFES